MSFNVVVSDNPWAFGDKLPGVRGAESHYPCMSTADLCELDLPPIDKDAILFQWMVSSMIEDALVVTSAWGFTVKTTLTWVKTKNGVVEPQSPDDLAFGMGRSLRAASEHCLVATRGKYSHLIKNHSIRNVFFAARGEHSEKPEAFYKIVEDLTGEEARRVELFARKSRPGWSAFGHGVGSTLNVRPTSVIVKCGAV